MKSLGLGLLAITVVLAACGGGSSATPTPTVAPTAIPTGTVEHAPLTLDLWSPWGADQKEALDALFTACQTRYPWMTINHTSKPDKMDEALLASVTAGNPPDAAMTFSPELLGQIAKQEIALPLDDFATRDAIDWNAYTAGALTFSSFEGKHYALPFAEDAYGLFYNRKMLAAAGFSAPPETLSQLDELNQKLTKLDASGNIVQMGFLPPESGYPDTPVSFYLGLFGGKVLSEDLATSTIGTDPTIPEMLRWQKHIYDMFGAEKVKTFQAGFGNYDSKDHPFLKGQLAMVMSGEWLAGYPERYLGASKLDFGVSTFPYPDQHPDRKGFAGVGGNILMIPRGSKHPEEAWALIKCLATDADANAAFNKAIGNIPPTKAAIAASSEQSNPTFKPFLDLALAPNATFDQISPIGDAVTEPLGKVTERYLAGKIDDADLAAALMKAQTEAQAQLDQENAP